MDHDQNEGRGHGYLPPTPPSGGAHPVNEGNRGGAVAARDRDSGQGRSSGPRALSDRRQSDQAVRLAVRGEAFAPAGRTHAGDSDSSARLQRRRSRGDQNIGRHHAAGKTGARRSGVVFSSPVFTGEVLRSDGGGVDLLTPLRPPGTFP